MRILQFIAFIFLTIVSCKNEEQKNGHNLSNEQFLKIKDSIENIYSIRQVEYLSDSLKVDLSKGYLGNIYFSDTLVLSAQFADCGEFGGHEEYLKIYSKKDQFECLFINKLVDCDKNYYDFVKIDSTLYNMTNETQKKVSDYITELTRISMMRQDLDTNYFNIYKFEIRPSHLEELYEGIPKMYISFYDQSLVWKKFENLRDAIKTNANNAYSK